MPSRGHTGGHQVQTKERASLAAAQGTNLQGVLRRHWNNQKCGASKL